MDRRVVVTGIGVVSPLGNTVADTWQGLLDGRSGAGPIRRFDPSNLDVRFGCEVKNFEPLKFIDKKEAKRYDRFLQFAIAAAHEATCDAGLEGRAPDGERTGVIIGSGIGGIMTFEEQCRICITEGPSRVSPFFVPMFIPNIASGIVSIRYGAKVRTTAPCPPAPPPRTRSESRTASSSGGKPT